MDDRAGLAAHQLDRVVLGQPGDVAPVDAQDHVARAQPGLLRRRALHRGGDGEAPVRRLDPNADPLVVAGHRLAHALLLHRLQEGGVVVAERGEEAARGAVDHPLPVDRLVVVLLLDQAPGLVELVELVAQLGRHVRGERADRDPDRGAERRRVQHPALGEDPGAERRQPEGHQEGGGHEAAHGGREAAGDRHAATP